MNAANGATLTADHVTTPSRPMMAPDTAPIAAPPIIQSAPAASLATATFCAGTKPAATAGPMTPVCRRAAVARNRPLISPTEVLADWRVTGAQGPRPVPAAGYPSGRLKASANRNARVRLEYLLSIGPAPGRWSVSRRHNRLSAIITLRRTVPAARELPISPCGGPSASAKPARICTHPADLACESVQLSITIRCKMEQLQGCSSAAGGAVDARNRPGQTKTEARQLCPSTPFGRPFNPFPCPLAGKKRA